ncbi:MAG: hypothetical protein HY050_05885 [Actinobacteria bacterium]|nr:hypothetical protein [Actinomycetota bacterium]
MRIRRLVIVTAALALTLTISNLLTSRVTARSYSQNYPAVVCPPTDSTIASVVSTASTKTLYRVIVGKSTVLTPIKSTPYIIEKDAILLDQGEVTAVTWQASSGVWAGASLCLAPQGDQWFVGGSGDVTSKGRLVVVNSGLSEAIVDVAVWSERGAQSGKVLTVPANSSVRVPLDSLAAGQVSLTLRVSSRSGRVNAFLIDERKKGLQNLGGDLVGSAEFPRTDFVISGIPQQTIGGKSGSHFLRVLTPGNTDANIRVELISKDGVFAPIGLDDRNVVQGQVTDIPLNPTINASVFSLRIRSDQPIVAAVYSVLKVQNHQDFMWSSVTSKLEPMTLAVKSLSPVFVFTGDLIRLKVSTRLTNGSTKYSTLVGNDILRWKVPANALTVKFSDIRYPISGAGLLSTTSGVGTFPLTPGSTLARAAVPQSNIEVINR